MPSIMPRSGAPSGCGRTRRRRGRGRASPAIEGGDRQRRRSRRRRRRWMRRPPSVSSVALGHRRWSSSSSSPPPWPSPLGLGERDGRAPGARAPPRPRRSAGSTRWTAPPSQVWITGKRIVSPGVSGTCTDSPNCLELVVGERSALPGHDRVALGVLRRRGRRPPARRAASVRLGDRPARDHLRRWRSRCPRGSPPRSWWCRPPRSRGARPCRTGRTTRRPPR